MDKENRYVFKELRKLLKKDLSKSRYEHILGVEYTAAALAMRYEADIFWAELAGLMHDCAKYLSGEEMLSYCKKYNIPISEIEKKNPYLLHGKLGSYFCKHKYDISNKEVLSAIACHTTGRPAMNLLEKIIYVADYIEPRRDKAPNLNRIRKAAFEDIDEAIYLITRDTLNYLEADSEPNISEESSIDPMTRETFEYYKKIHDNKLNT